MQKRVFQGRSTMILSEVFVQERLHLSSLSQCTTEPSQLVPRSQKVGSMPLLAKSLDNSSAELTTPSILTKQTTLSASSILWRLNRPFVSQFDFYVYHATFFRNITPSIDELKSIEYVKPHYPYPYPSRVEPTINPNRRRTLFQLPTPAVRNFHDPTFRPLYLGLNPPQSAQHSRFPLGHPPWSTSPSRQLLSHVSARLHDRVHH